MHYIKNTGNGYDIGHYNPQGAWISFMTWAYNEYSFAVESVRKLNGGSQ